MPTAYDTFNYSQALRDATSPIDRLGQGRLAIAAQEYERRVQEQRDASRYKANLDLVNAQHLGRVKAERDIARASLEDQYLSLYKDATRSEVEKMDTGELMAGVNRYQDNNLAKLAKMSLSQRDSAMQRVLDVLGEAGAKKNKQIAEAMRKDPALIAAIQKNARGDAASKFAEGKIGIDEVLEQSGSRKEDVLSAYAQAFTAAGSAFTDDDGNPIIPPETQLQLQNLMGEVQAHTQRAFQEYNSIRDAEIRSGVFPDIGTESEPSSFRDDDLGIDLPTPPSPAPADSQASTPDPAAQSGIFDRAVRSFTNPVSTYDPERPGIIRRGFNAVTDAMANSVVRKYGPEDTGTSPLPMPGQSGPSSFAVGQDRILLPGKYPSTNAESNLREMGYQNMDAANAQQSRQDPFMMQRVGNLLSDTFGNVDDATRTRAWEMAIQDGRTESELKGLVQRAFSGDMAAKQLLRGYAQRASGGLPMR